MGGLWWYRCQFQSYNAVACFFFSFLFYFRLWLVWSGIQCVLYTIWNISHLIENNWHFDQDFKFVMHFMLHQNEIKWVYFIWIWKVKLNPNIPSVWLLLVSQFIGRMFAHIMSINSNWFFLFQCWKLVRLSVPFPHSKFAHVAGIF